MKLPPTRYTDEELLNSLLPYGSEEPPQQDEIDGAAANPLPVAEGDAGPSVKAVLAGNAEPVKLAAPPSENPAPVAEPVAPAQPPAAAPTPAPTPTPVAQTRESRLVSTKPHWYDFEPPPKVDTGAEVGKSVALGGGLALLLGLLGGKKHLDKAVTAGVLTGGLGALDAATSNENDNYERRLRAAERQADMHKTLSSSGQFSDNSLGWANHNLSKEKWAAEQKATAEKARLFAAKERLDSPETRALQDALIQLGQVPEQTARKMTGNQIEKFRVQGTAAARQDENFGNQRDMHNIRQQSQVEAEQRAQGYKLEGEDRERVAKLDEAYIPGRVWQRHRAPSPEMVRYATKINEKALTIKHAADRLAELQDMLSPVYQGLATPAQIFGSDEQQKEILNEMIQMREALNANLRSEEGYNFGVPQQYELALLEKINPNADSIMTFFKGPYAWRQMGKVVSNLAETRLKSLGSVPDDGREPEAAPKATKTGQQRLKEAAQAVPQAAALVGDAANTTTKFVGEFQKKLPDGSWSKPVKLTAEKYKQIMESLAREGKPQTDLRKAQP